MNQKPKIVLLSDCPLHGSGVGNMVKYLCKKMVQRGFEVVSIGMVNEHTRPPSPGLHRFDSGEVIKLYIMPKPAPNFPTCCNPALYNEIMNQEKPDCLILFQDPYKYYPLWNSIYTTRTKLPIYFINIWDTYLAQESNGKAHYLLPLYENIDAFGCYSRQTEWFTNKVFEKLEYGTKPPVIYTGFGSNSDMFKPLPLEDYKDTKNVLFQGREFDFTVIMNNANQGRKKLVDGLEAFRLFNESLPKEKSDKTALVIHCDAITDFGTNIPEVIKALAPDQNIFHSASKVPESLLCQLYNSCDIYMSLANAEGFGLCPNEASLCGLPLLINATGGMVDQCGFIDSTNNPLPWTKENKLNLCNFKHGKWVYPLYPHRTIIGNPVTQYLYDENADIDDAVKGLQYWYNMDSTTRKQNGLSGREYCLNNQLTANAFCNNVVKDVQTCITNFKPQPQCQLYRL